MVLFAVTQNYEILKFTTDVLSELFVKVAQPRHFEWTLNSCVCFSFSRSKYIEMGAMFLQVLTYFE